MNNLLLGIPVYLYILILITVIYISREGYFREISDNFIELITKNKLVILLVIAITFFLVYFVDFPVTNFFFQHRNIQALVIIQEVGNTIGNGKFLFPCLTTIILYSIVFQREKSKWIKTCKISLASGVYAGIFVLIVKSIVERQRPFVGLDPYRFFDFVQAIQQGQLFGFDYASFPSGHVVMASSFIIPFAYAYRKKILGKLLWLYPIIVAVARVYSLNHWCSDVFFGFVCGSFIAVATYQANAKRMRLERF